MSDEEKYFTEIKNGKLAVRTVAQTGDIIDDRPADKYWTALVQTANGPVECVKTYSVGGGGGGGGTSDYTDLDNKPQINSVTLTGNKTGEDLKLATNKATGTDALSFIGTATTKAGAVNIGKTSSAGTAYNVAIGENASAGGNNVSASPAYGASTAAYGYYASATAGTAIGSMTYASNGVAIGRGHSSARKVSASMSGAIAIGFISTSSENCAATAEKAIQLGAGSNNTASTFQVYSYQLLNGKTGKIPADRMTGIVTLTTTSVKLDSDNIYNGAELASVTFTLPSTIPANFTAQLNFTSGATATVLNAPNTVYFEGDDCSNGVLTPVANKRYQILIASDGVNVNGYVISR